MNIDRLRAILSWRLDQLCPVVFDLSRRRITSRHLVFRLTVSSAGTIFSLGGQTRRVGGWTRSGKLTLILTSC